MSPLAIEMVRRLEQAILPMPQVVIEMTHTLHAGVYARTARLPAGVVLTGALIKIPTVLIVQGRVLVYLRDRSEEFRGYHVLTAAAGRKSAIVAIEDTHLTMIFASQAQTVAEAEREFTDEVDMLMSRGA